MNTGLQDAHNIAWKLAMVISGKADKSLLSTYQSGYELILFCPFNAFSFFFLSLTCSLSHTFSVTVTISISSYFSSSPSHYLCHFLSLSACCHCLCLRFSLCESIVELFYLSHF